eukprot:CAMPEP_0206278632 /NCGR_PEP_ID=MMETSP0047_2-20121206/37529_1 /ASSEMBLY_ACC=CAM_ASM_000192 /TAXON_ID=195065 /ORGANISM="Chroomonas mesostigmatica_cf, Strain CCMP1168" /LENGTH=73 /DNA_ID=CAMNT_0053708401 /DNA_START=18 /DNA_END=236 /DNA_ORIENTATION=-
MHTPGWQAPPRARRILGWDAGRNKFPSCLLGRAGQTNAGARAFGAAASAVSVAHRHSHLTQAAAIGTTEKIKL